MRNKIFFILLIFSFSCKFSFSQWTQLEQPTGGNSWAIERVGYDIWDATNHGIFVSTNEGASWSHHPSLYAPTMDIEAIGDTVILLIQENPSLAVYYLSTVTSFDGGNTWGNPVIAETDNSYFTYGRREMYVTDSSIIINSNSSSYYRSTNYGLNWNLISLPGGSNGQVDSYTNKHVLSHTYSGTVASYLSDDGGGTWNFLDSNYVSGSQIIVDTTIFSAWGYYDTSYHYQVMRTNDFGQTWDTVLLNTVNYPGQLYSFSGRIIYLINPYPQTPTIYESVDMGTTWSISSLPYDLMWATDDRSILLSNFEHLISLWSSGIYRYNYTTGVYYHTETGIKAHGIEMLKENKGKLFAKTDGKLYMSANAGATFTSAPEFVNGGSKFIFRGDTILGFTKSINYQQKLCVSYDNGNSWDSIIPLGNNYFTNPIYVEEVNGKLFIGLSNYCSVSSDWGANWDSIPVVVDTLCSSSQWPNMYVDIAISFLGNLFVHDDYLNAILKLDTLSNSWVAKRCSVSASYKGFFALDNVIAFCSSNNFLISSDTGNTWTYPLRIGLPPTIKPTSISCIDGVWYSPANGDIYYSFDHGDNWQQLATNSEMLAYNNTEQEITSLNSILYAGGNNIWMNNDTLQLISGNVYFDNNNNGIKEAGEQGIPNIVLHTTPYNIAYTTDSLGNYSFLTATVGDTLKPNLPTQFCSSNPPYYLTNGSATNANFGIYFYPGIQDLAVDITNRCPFRPFFNTLIDVEVKNNGTVLLPSQLEVVLDTSLIYVNSSVSPTQINGDTLTFSIDTIPLLQSERITIETQTGFAVPISTPIICTATVLPIAGDTVPANNVSQINTQVVGSFDPNDKSSQNGLYFTPTQVQNGDEMIYTIRFQNTGNFQADNVRIVDTLSGFFDLSSFRIVSSSHAMHYSINGNGVTNFYFDNIFLPAISVDEPASHGFVRYAVKCFSSLNVGDAIDNTAYIYFDFNAPIQTNTHTTLIADPPFNLSTQEIVNVSHVTIFPNPANNYLNGKFDTNQNKEFVFYIFNPQGKLIRSEKINGSGFSLNTNEFANGMYYGKILIAPENKLLFFKFIISH